MLHLCGRQYYLVSGKTDNSMKIDDTLCNFANYSNTVTQTASVDLIGMQI